jgi:hypothetical protein
MGMLIPSTYWRRSDFALLTEKAPALSLELPYSGSGALNSGTVSVCPYSTDCRYVYWFPTRSVYVTR